MSHTPGPWLRANNTVYALQHDGWRKGVETFRNRFHAYVQADRACSDEEHEANCLLLAAAPELLEVLQTIVRVADGRQLCGNLILDENSPLMGAARDVIAKATGAPE